MLDFQIYSQQGKTDTIEEPTAVTVGMFDGVHRGHQHLISLLSQTGYAPTAVSLSNHPSVLFGRKNDEQWLDEPDEHIDMLFNAGARYVAVLPFNVETAKLTACQMATDMFHQLNMRHLLSGYDGRFGNRANDDSSQLPQLGTTLGFGLNSGDAYIIGNNPVSSSRIREALSCGNINEVTNLLGYNYTLRGTVCHGRGIGHSLGFATANVDLSQSRKMWPQEGVYIVQMAGRKGVANIGPQPTFGQETPIVEVHLPGFHGNLYGTTQQVTILSRIRDIYRFESSNQLKAQIADDIKKMEEYR